MFKILRVFSSWNMPLILSTQNWEWNELLTITIYTRVQNKNIRCYLINIRFKKKHENVPKFYIRNKSIINTQLDCWCVLKYAHKINIYGITKHKWKWYINDSSIAYT